MRWRVFVVVAVLEVAHVAVVAGRDVERHVVAVAIHVLRALRAARAARVAAAAAHTALVEDVLLRIAERAARRAILRGVLGRQCELHLGRVRQVTNRVRDRDAGVVLREVRAGREEAVDLCELVGARHRADRARRVTAEAVRLDRRAVDDRLVRGRRARIDRDRVPRLYEPLTASSRSCCDAVDSKRM